MNTTHDAALCRKIIRFAIENRPVSREQYVSSLGDCGYNNVAIFSALTYLVHHGVFTNHKGLIGLSNPQLAAATFWEKLDIVIQATEEGSNASTTGKVQDPVGQS